jgi:hypothetical protein
MRPRVVICGSFRRDAAGLRALFQELETTGCRVLSPLSIDFAGTNAGFVKADNENDFTVNELERFHLRALRDADFVWLHAPEGHVGTSVTYELGFAAALHKQIFSFETPIDEMLASQIQTAKSVFAALKMNELIP